MKVPPLERGISNHPDAEMKEEGKLKEFRLERGISTFPEGNNDKWLYTNKVKF
tara:strand:- start:431 stop:589 length:159 start_codon:yes stop_codon:yes gene_type:complete